METALDFPTLDMTAHHAPAAPLFERPAPPPRMLEQTAIARGIESVSGAVGEFDRIAAGLAAIEAEQARVAVNAAEIPEGRDSQHVLKAEAAVPDATDRETPVDASPSVGSMGSGQPADAGPTADARPPIKLGDVCARLGFTMTAAFVTDTLKISPIGTDKRAVLFAASHFDRICAALVKHIEAVAAWAPMTIYRRCQSLGTSSARGCWPRSPRAGAKWRDGRSGWCRSATCLRG